MIWQRVESILKKSVSNKRSSHVVMKLIFDKQDINEISKLKGFHLKSRTYSLILLGEVIPRFCTT